MAVRQKLTWSDRYLSSRMRRLTSEDDEIFVKNMTPGMAQAYFVADSVDAGRMETRSRWTACRREVAKDRVFFKRFMEEFYGFMEPMTEQSFMERVWGAPGADVKGGTLAVFEGSDFTGDEPALFECDGMFIIPDTYETNKGITGRRAWRTGWAVWGTQYFAGDRDTPPDCEDVRVTNAFPSLRQAFLWMIHDRATAGINQRIDDTCLFVDSEIDKEIIREYERRVTK